MWYRAPLSLSGDFQILPHFLDSSQAGWPCKAGVSLQGGRWEEQPPALGGALVQPISACTVHAWVPRSQLLRGDR